MNKSELIEKIEGNTNYRKVRIAADGEITGMLADQDHRYDPHTNTGGRRYLGNFNDVNLHHVFPFLAD